MLRQPEQLSQEGPVAAALDLSDVALLLQASVPLNVDLVEALSHSSLADADLRREVLEVAPTVGEWRGLPRHVEAFLQRG